MPQTRSDERELKVSEILRSPGLFCPDQPAGQPDRVNQRC